MAAKTEKIQARVSPSLKASAENIFRHLGISPTEAIRMFYSQVTLHQGLPFDVRIPNEVTLEAMREAEHPENLETFDSVDDLFAGLE